MSPNARRRRRIDPFPSLQTGPAGRAAVAIEALEPRRLLTGSSSLLPVTVTAPDGSTILAGQTNAFDFPAAAAGNVGLAEVFFVENPSGTAVTLSPLSVPPGFVVVEPLPSTLDANGGGEFTIRAVSDAVGRTGGTVSFEVSPGGTFSFPVSASVVPAEFSLAAVYPVSPPTDAASDPDGILGELRHPVLADFNGDGKADLAAVDGATGTLSVRLGSGDGAFGASTETGGFFDALDIAAADVTGDHAPDLVVLTPSAIHLVVRTAGGQYIRGATVDLPVNHESSTEGSFSVADLNGDGAADVVAPLDDGSLLVVLASGVGGLSSPRVTSTPFDDITIAAVDDVTGDGRPDVVFPGGYSSQLVTVLPGNGDGTFGAPVTSSFASGADDVTLADVNGDGRLDLIVASSFDPAQVYLNTGGGTFGPARAVPAEPGAAVAAADLNGDGKVDLLATAGEYDADHGAALVLTGNGDGTFAGPVAYRAGANPNGLAVADVNGDGRADFLVANEDDSTVSVFLRHAAATGPATGDPGNPGGAGDPGVPGGAGGGPGDTPTAGPARTIEFDAKRPATYTDARGNVVKVTLKGKGAGTIAFDAPGKANAASIRLTHTSAANSTVTITSRGKTTVGDLSADHGLKTISAKTTSFTGAVDAGGTLGSLTAASFAPGSRVQATSVKTVTVPGAFAADVAVRGGVGRASLGNVGGGSWVVGRGGAGAIALKGSAPSVSATFAGPVKSLKTSGALGGDWAAKTFSAVTIGGSAAHARLLAGASFGADGRLGGGDDRFAAGSIGRLSVAGQVTSSLFAAGVDPVDGVFLNGDDRLLSNSSIKSVSLRKGADAASRVVASKLPARAVLKKPLDTRKHPTFTLPVVDYPAAITALSATTVAPLGDLTLTGSFPTDTPLAVRFTTAAGYSLAVPAVAVSATSVRLAVPPLTDPAAGTYVPGVASVQVINRNDGTPLSKPVPGLTVAGLPRTSLPPGQVALAALDGQIADADATVAAYDAAGNGSAPARSEAAALADGLRQQRADVAAAASGSPVPYGTIGTHQIALDAHALEMMDRLLLARLAADARIQGPAGPAQAILNEAAYTPGDLPASASLRVASAQSVSDGLATKLSNYFSSAFKDKSPVELAGWALAATAVIALTIPAGAALAGVALGAEVAEAGLVLNAAGAAFFEGSSVLSMVTIGTMGVLGSVTWDTGVVTGNTELQERGEEMVRDAAVEAAKEGASKLAGKLAGEGLENALTALQHADALGLYKIEEDAVAPAPTFTVGGGNHTDPGDDFKRIQKLSQEVQQIPALQATTLDYDFSVDHANDGTWDPNRFARTFSTEIGNLFEDVLFLWKHIKNADSRAAYKPLVDDARSGIVDRLHKEANTIDADVSFMKQRIQELQSQPDGPSDLDQKAIDKYRQDIKTEEGWPAIYNDIATQFEQKA